MLYSWKAFSFQQALERNVKVFKDKKQEIIKNRQLHYKLYNIEEMHKELQFKIQDTEKIMKACK